MINNNNFLIIFSIWYPLKLTTNSTKTRTTRTVIKILIMHNLESWYKIIEELHPNKLIVPNQNPLHSSEKIEIEQTRLFDFTVLYHSCFSFRYNQKYRQLWLPHANFGSLTRMELRTPDVHQSRNSAWF